MPAKKKSPGKIPPAAKKLTSAAQIGVLKSLSPQAAAYLAGVPLSTLRDRAHKCPPSDDGTYDGQAVVRFATESSPPVDMSDDDTEKALRIVEGFAGFYDQGLSPAAVPYTLKILRDLQEKYGGRFASSFLALMVEFYDEYVQSEDLPPPSEKPNEVPFPSDAELLKSAREEYAKARSEVSFSRPHQCDKCGSVRCGREWVDREIQPNDFPITAGCPSCYPDFDNVYLR